MKKILIPFGGSHFPGGLLEFAGRIHPMNPVMLTVAFVRQADRAGVAAWDGSSDMGEDFPGERQYKAG